MSRVLLIASVFGVLAVTGTNVSAQREAGSKSAALAVTADSCTIFPEDNPWNQDIAALPVDPKSANYIASINRTRQFLHPDFGSDPTYGIPYIVVSRDQPKIPV